jgi:hypothetical protein
VRATAASSDQRSIRLDESSPVPRGDDDANDDSADDGIDVVIIDDDDVVWNMQELMGSPCLGRIYSAPPLGCSRAPHRGKAHARKAQAEHKSARASLPDAQLPGETGGRIRHRC